MAQSIRETGSEERGQSFEDSAEEQSEPVRPSGTRSQLSSALRREVPGNAEVGSRLTPEFVFATQFDFVWRNLRRMGVAPSALDDSVQEVFVVVCRCLHTLHGAPQLRAWLFSIATHVASKARRTERRRGALPLPDVLPDPRSISPHEATAHAEAARVVQALLGGLSPAMRAVFVLAHFEQFTAPEIALALDLPPATVYSRLRAARAAMEAGLRRHRARSGESLLLETDSPWMS